MVKVLIFLTKTSVITAGLAVLIAIVGIMIDTHAYNSTENDSFLIERNK